MYKIMIAVTMLFVFVGCGDDAVESKKSTESSSMMLNAKMIDKARDTVAKENKRANTTLDDVEKKK